MVDVVLGSRPVMGGSGTRGHFDASAIMRSATQCACVCVCVYSVASQEHAMTARRLQGVLRARGRRWLSSSAPRAQGPQLQELLSMANSEESRRWTIGLRRKIHEHPELMFVPIQPSGQPPKTIQRAPRLRTVRPPRPAPPLTSPAQSKGASYRLGRLQLTLTSFPRVHSPT